MDQQKFQIMLDVFKALADANRLKIVGMVAEKPCSVEELSERLKIKASTVSHHLNRLKEADLVSMQRDKNVHLYSLSLDQLHFLSKEIMALDQVTAPEDNKQLWNQKVLHTFVVDQQLSKIPASRKKREVILNWLVSHFEFDRHYPEKELNQIISAYHPDTATLRRELIACKLMQRENQVYWRIHPQS